jgi:hypothetical protein
MKRKRLRLRGVIALKIIKYVSAVAGVVLAIFIASQVSATELEIRKHWGTDNVSGDGPGTADVGGWLLADINGDGREEIVQSWNNGGKLGMIVYGTDQSSVMGKLWGSSNVSGDGPGAKARLVGDLNGDGRDEIIQVWDSGNIGMIVYGTDGDFVIKTLWATPRVSAEGAGAVQYLIGDINGDGRDEVIQAWRNGGTLGIIVYGTDGDFAMKKKWATGNVSGDGAGAIAWLLGDVNGDGRDEVIQAWDNSGTLGMIVYGTDGDFAMKKHWGTARVSGDGSGVANPGGWMIGDINGDGRDEVIQNWNSGVLGMIVYGTDGDFVMKRHWGTSDVSGDGSGAVARLIGDINGDGRDEIVQQRANGDKLGTIVYGATEGYAVTRLFVTSNVSGDGPGAVAWFIGNFNNDGYDEIVQAWDNGGKLGMIQYKAPRANAPKTSNETKLALLYNHAPLVWLAQGEEFMPSSVDWAFDHVQRVLASDGRYWLNTKTTLSSPSDFSLPLFKGDLESARAYGFAVDKGEALDLVYFIYYPYNRGKEMVNTMWGNHVSDWEHITVRYVWNYDQSTGEWSQNLQGVYVQAHNFGGAYPWSAITKQGSHPVVYSAWGSHGFWAAPGNHVYKKIAGGVGGTLSDSASQGTEWRTWDSLETYDYSSKSGLGDSQWPTWMSDQFKDAGVGDPTLPRAGAIYRWGNSKQGCDAPDFITGECRLNDAPTGPVSKGVWNPAVFQ